VFGQRVIGFVHRNRIRIMVDGNINLAANSLLNPCAGSATSGEVVYYQLIIVYV